MKYLSNYLQFGAFTNDIYALIFLDPFFSELKEDAAFKEIIQETLAEKAEIRKQVSLISD